MNFRLTTVLWLFALFGSAMGTFGPGLGGFPAVVVSLIHLAVAKPLAGLKLLAAFMLFCLLIALLLPAVSSAREAANRIESMINLKQLVLGMHNFHDVRKRFPAACSVDAGGKPEYSWRIQLLPFVESSPLWGKIKQNGPWDSPANKQLLLGFDSYCMRSPRDAVRDSAVDETHYFAIVDEETVWSPTESVAFSDITDGAANTIMLIEAAGRGVKWYEPRDLTLDEAVDLLTGKFEEPHEWIDEGFYLSSRYRSDGLHPRLVAWADGHVSAISVLRDRAVARALLTKAGGEDVTDWEEAEARGQAGAPEFLGYLIHWGRVWGTAVFVGLTFMPLFRPSAPGSAGGSSESTDDVA